jgi:hypothetical protein
MIKVPKKVRRKLDRTAELYDNVLSLRMAVALIPYIGGPLDVLLSGKGARIRRERLQFYIEDLRQRLQGLENGKGQFDEEKLWDLTVAAIEGVARARSKKKIRRFSSIVSSMVREQRSEEDAIKAIDLAAELDDIHVEILSVARRAPESKKPFEGHRVVTLLGTPEEDISGAGPPSLQDELRYYKKDLHIACAQLVSKWLLHDEGIGRMSTSSMQYFVLTDAGQWFCDWLMDHNLTP